METTSVPHVRGFCFLVTLIVVSIHPTMAECTASQKATITSVMLERNLDASARTSFSMKWLNRMGDSAAECLIDNYRLNDLQDDSMFDIVASILSDSFADSELIEGTKNRKPTMSLLLLAYLSKVRPDKAPPDAVVTKLFNRLSTVDLSQATSSQ